MHSKPFAVHGQLRENKLKIHRPALKEEKHRFSKERIARMKNRQMWESQRGARSNGVAFKGLQKTVICKEKGFVTASIWPLQGGITPQNA
jgi:hypothetical protein